MFVRLTRAEKRKVRRSWLKAQPGLLLFQSLKAFRGAGVSYFTGFGGQKETTVRRNLRRLVEGGFMRRRPSKYGRGFDYTLTRKGLNTVWKGRDPFPRAAA
jgi:DNA-binding transcriptional regulator PaaX